MVESGLQGEALIKVIKNSLRKDRWQPLDLGEDKNYTGKAIQDRWTQQRNAWLNEKNPGPDVRGAFSSKGLPIDPNSQERRHVKRTMKALQGPYEGFKYHYPLEEAIDIYMEIWYDSSSSDS